MRPINYSSERGGSDLYKDIPEDRRLSLETVFIVKDSREAAHNNRKDAPVE